MQIKPGQILFLDVETVSQYASYNEMTDYEKHLWSRKAKFLQVNEDKSDAEKYAQAAIYAEYGKIVCISAAYLNHESGKKYSLRMKSYSGHDEKKLLQEFAGVLEDFTRRENNLLLCAHNGKEFDYPYIVRRMLINGIKLPEILNLQGKKPWEIPHLDTLELWKFGDYKHYTGLEVLAHLFKLPTPKDEIDGSMVSEVYWQKKDLDAIVKYCEKDVSTLVRLYFKLCGMDLEILQG